MIKKVLLTLVVCIISSPFFAQQQNNQRIAFVDIEYVLENIPEYAQAQTQLDKKVTNWQLDLDKIKSEIELMQVDLSNEKALLTADLIEEKEEDIAIKQEELKALESKYFSSNGDLFSLRKQLVTPIQDMVYNSVQEIAKTRRFDLVLNKSSDLIILYASKQADISDLVLRSIVRGERVNAANEKRATRNNNTRSRNTPQTAVEGNTDIKRIDDKSVVNSVSESNITTPEEANSLYNDVDEKQQKTDEREAKRQASIEKSEKAKADRLKKRDEQRAAVEKKRLERLKQREDVRNELKENKESPEEKENTDNKNNN